MTTNTAIEAYAAAATQEEACQAFDCLVEQIASDESLPDDADFVPGAEKALSDRGVKITHTSEAHWL